MLLIKRQLLTGHLRKNREVQAKAERSTSRAKMVDRKARR